MSSTPKKRGRPKGALNRNKTLPYHLAMLDKARRKLARETGKPMYTPIEYWLLTMNDTEAQPARRDAAADALAGYTYHKPQAEVSADNEPKQPMMFGWSYPDAADTAALQAESAAGTSSRPN